MQILLGTGSDTMTSILCDLKKFRIKTPDIGFEIVLDIHCKKALLTPELQHDLFFDFCAG